MKGYVKGLGGGAGGCTHTGQEGQGLRVKCGGCEVEGTSLGWRSFRD